MTGSLSAGVLLYRTTGGTLEVLIAHPGGPYWRNRDAGAWTIPKGLLEEGEDVLAAAAREFAEETGAEADLETAVDLGRVRLRSGKRVHAWGVAGDMDPADLVSNTFEAEWPPRSGVVVDFPEIDRVAWVTPPRARVLLNPGLIPLVEALVDHLSSSP